MSSLKRKRKAEPGESDQRPTTRFRPFFPLKGGGVTTRRGAKTHVGSSSDEEKNSSAPKPPPKLPKPSKPKQPTKPTKTGGKKDSSTKTAPATDPAPTTGLGSATDSALVPTTSTTGKSGKPSGKISPSPGSALSSPPPSSPAHSPPAPVPPTPSADKSGKPGGKSASPGKPSSSRVSSSESSGYIGFNNSGIPTEVPRLRREWDMPMETTRPRGIRRGVRERHCYQTSLLQIWLNTPVTAQFIRDFHVPRTCELGSKDQCMRCALKRFFDVYRGRKGRKAAAVNDAFAAFQRVVKNTWERPGGAKELESGDQHDCADFLVWIVQRVSSELSEHNYTMPQLSQLWHEIFFIGWETRVRCAEGHDVREDFEWHPVFRVKSSEGAGVMDLVKLWLGDEILHSEETGRCSECNRRVDKGTRYKQVSRIPELLHIAPNQFDKNYKRTNYHLAMPHEAEVMDFSELFREDEGYVLEGDTSGSGHGVRRFVGLIARSGTEKVIEKKTKTGIETKTTMHGHYITGLYAPTRDFIECNDSAILQHGSLAQWWRDVRGDSDGFNANIYVFAKDDTPGQSIENPEEVHSEMEPSGKPSSGSGGSQTESQEGADGKSSSDPGKSPSSRSSSSTKESGDSKESPIRWSGTVYYGTEKGLSFSDRETDLFPRRIFREQELIQIPTVIRCGKQRRFTVLSGMIAKKKEAASVDEGKLVSETHALYRHLLKGRRAGLFTERSLYRVMEALGKADAALDRYETRISKVQGQRNEAQERLEHLGKFTKGKGSEILTMANLEGYLEDAKQEVEDVRQDLEDAKKELADCKKHRRDKQAEIDQLHSQLEDTQQDLSECEEEGEHMQTEIEELGGQLHDRARELEGAQQNLADCEKHREDMQTKIDRLRDQLNDLEEGNQSPENPSTTPPGDMTDNTDSDTEIFKELAESLLLEHLENRKRHSRPASEAPSSGVSKGARGRRTRGRR